LHLTHLALVIPAAYHTSQKSSPESIDALSKLSNSLKNGIEGDTTHDGVLAISRGTAILLLIVYVAYLFFQASR
jgi:Ca2+:H+ antiporter